MSKAEAKMPPIQITGPAVHPSARSFEKQAESRVMQPAPGAAARRGNRNDASLNHLLSFTLPPRQHPPPRTSRRSAGNHRGGWHNTRERYINAQYRFILKPTGDYTVHFADPDIYFHWPDVLQVIVPTSSVLLAAAHTFEGPSTSADSLTPQCPICLSEPVAPRMTKCGHIFCYPCLLHYLELADAGTQKARSCPICFDTVRGRDLKSVKWFDPASAASQSASAQVAGEEEEKEGTYITMRLIQRTNISTLALPRSPTWPSEIMPPHATPWHFAPDTLPFSRFMLATPDYMSSELRNDLRQLEGEIANLVKLGTKADDISFVFIEAGKRKVMEQLEKVSVLRTESVQQASENAWFEIESLIDKEGAKARRMEREQERALTSATSASDTDDYVPPAAMLQQGNGVYAPPKKPTRTSSHHPSPLPTPPIRNQKPRRNLNPPAPNDATYLFYQAASGQHIYLSPLDIKLLKSHFESYAAFPLTIRVKVDGTEEGSIDEDLRKRCRYLSHLPEACDVTFVEADLSGVVPPEALVPYAQALKKRANKRKDKARRDDRAKHKSEQAAAEKEREHYRSSTFRAEPAAESFVFPELRTELDQVSQDPAQLSTSPTSNFGTSPLGGGAGGRQTVWGTRAIADAGGRGRGEDALVDLEMESAWHDFDSMQQRGGRKQGRKKKVVLNLAGGAVSMGRR